MHHDAMLITHFHYPHTHVVSIPRVKIIGLGKRGDKEKIRQEFSKIGPVRDVWITTNPPVCAYVVFERLQDAERALQTMYGKRLCGVNVTVELSPSKDRCQSGQDKKDTPTRHQQGHHIPTSHFQSRSSSQSHSHSSHDGGNRSSRAYSPSLDYGGRQSREGGSSRYSSDGHSRKHYLSSGPTSKKTDSAHSHTHHSTTEVRTTVTENKDNNPRPHSSSQSCSYFCSRSSLIGGKRVSRANLPSSHHGGHQLRKGGSAICSGAGQSIKHLAYTAMLACNDKLVPALSPDPRTIAGILMAKGFIPPEVQAEILLPSTPHTKATILVTAITEKIKIAPKRFHELIKIFSEQMWTKDVAEILQSAYQGN